MELLEHLEIRERMGRKLILLIGHELWAPLSAIQVGLENLATEWEMPTGFRAAMLEMARADLERLRQLIQDFLTPSHLESGQLAPGSIKLRATLEKLLKRTRLRLLEQCHVQSAPQLGGNHQTSSTDKNATHPEQVARLQRLEILEHVHSNLIAIVGHELRTPLSSIQVVLERLLPAVKIQARLRRARVGAVPELDSQSMLEVIVADTGRGIVPSHLEAIFNHFYQEESALRRNFGGTGIGLARARLIIQSLGGQIWADSAGQQQGSKFHFTVPVASNCE